MGKYDKGTLVTVSQYAYGLPGIWEIRGYNNSIYRISQGHMTTYAHESWIIPPV